MTGAAAANPVIRGFNPDPSILRVGDDYYLATSTFEWYPGIRLHHSRDLAHWQVIGHALDASNGFDLRGHPDSGGVWAPSLTHADGMFWLAYSVVRTMDGDDKDLDNYLVTAPDIDGPWSDPIRLGSRGFDFSFFHDDDGRHWIVGVQWDQRPGRPRFAGIALEEYLPAEHRTSGEARIIYSQDATLVEGPNLYRIDGEYHLLLAEGGTGWNHGVTTARANHLFGPYRRDPAPAVLTSRDDPGAPLQKAGHGELVQLPSGEWAMAHLASRPTLHLGERYSTLGRETCIQLVHFDDAGWLRLAERGSRARSEVELPLAPAPLPDQAVRDHFDRPHLDRSRWSTLRADFEGDLVDLTSRPHWLRLHGAQSTASTFDQAMVAQRITEHRTTIETLIDADPSSSRQAAGLLAWYDRSGWIWLQLTWDTEVGRHLRVVRRDGSRTSFESAAIPVEDGPLWMRMRLDGPELSFAISSEGNLWRPAAEGLPAWTLSDDHGPGLRFTGMFAGIRAEDLDGVGWHADFDYFTLVTG